jgi:hypothetical protein
MSYAVDGSQRKAAILVGICYFFGHIPAIFAEFYVSGRIINYENAAETARNIVANETLFRLGIAGNLIVFMADVVLIAALFVILERVNRNLALTAAFFRLIETGLLVLVTLNDLAVLRILSGAEYMQAFEPARLAGMARLAISAHNDAYRMGLLFFGLGSSVFALLWLKSAYVPKTLAALGIFASALVAMCMFAFVISPALARIVTVQYYAAPIFLFEVGLGLWLLIRGLRVSDNSEPRGTTARHLEIHPAS